MLSLAPDEGAAFPLTATLPKGSVLTMSDEGHIKLYIMLGCFGFAGFCFVADMLGKKIRAEAAKTPDIPVRKIVTAKVFTALEYLLALIFIALSLIEMFAPLGGGWGWNIMLGVGIAMLGYRLLRDFDCL